MSEHVKISRDGAVLEILFTRAEKKNAITNAMYRAIAEAMEQANDDPAVRVILFGSDNDSFSTGNDLNDFTGVATGQISPSELQAGRFLQALANAEKPLVAACPGLAVGVGCTMLLHCDLMYVSEQAKLTVPFVNLALVPEAASSMLLPARIGYARAYKMFALGEPVSGKEAAEIGIATDAVPASQVRARAMDYAQKLATRPAGALKLTKQLMRDPSVIKHVMEREGTMFKDRLRSPEALEAFRAFAERRAPDFTKVA